MNRNDDFDQTLAAWLRREAPSQAPDRVLEMALERVAAQSQARGWLNRLQGGTQMGRILRVAAVAAVIAFAAFIGYQFSNLSPDVGASPSPSVEANPSQSGLPSGSASPSTEPAAALVLRLEGAAEDGRTHVLTVLENGRVISGRPAVERRLTAAGVQLLRDELDATGLTFLASTDYSPVAKPGTEQPGFGGAGPALAVGLPGGGTAVITWRFFNDIDQIYDLEPQPEAEALDALAARLSTLDDWLPANAWADANAKPYAPAQYRVHVIGNPWGGSLDDLVEVSEVSIRWPVSATELLDQIVATSGASDSTSQECSVLASADAELVQAALVEAGAPAADYFLPSYRLGDRDAVRVMELVFEPILPLDERGCDGGYSLHF
ncbi:MAG: hypothetical protein ABI458_04230 [Chloroflexota bacterium]